MYKYALNILLAYIAICSTGNIFSQSEENHAPDYLIQEWAKHYTIEQRMEKAKSELSGPDIGGRGKRSMKRKIKYTDEPRGKVKLVADFLPSPEELALKDETVKVTISLSKTSVDFFKNEAN